MSDFISDDEMNELESSAPAGEADSADFISDDDMSAMEATSVVKDDSSSLPSEATTAIGGAVGGLGAEGARRVGATVSEFAAETLPGVAEDLAFRGIGGKTTPIGKKFSAESLVPEVSEEIVNVTPRSIGRQILDENILGDFGLASPENQLLKQREISKSKMLDKANFLQGFDSPEAINKQNLLQQYKELAGIEKLDPALDIDRSIQRGFNADQGLVTTQVPGTDELKTKSNFDGTQSILSNEGAKSKLQSRVNYEGTSKESARQALDKAQAEARRKASEEAVKLAKGEDALKEFQGLKQRSGNSQVAEKIMMRNVMSDGISPNTINPTLKLAGELALEKAPAVGSKIADFGAGVAEKAGQILSSGPAKKLIPLAGTLGGLATGNMAQAAEEAPGDIPILGQAYEAIRPETAGSVEDDLTMKAEGDAYKAYQNSPAAQDKNPAPASGAYTTPNDKRDKLEKDLNSLTGLKKSKEPVQADFAEFTEISSQDLNSLSQMFSSNDSPAAQLYAGPLEKAAQAKDARTKDAILWGMHQQPAFRQLYKQIKAPKPM